MYKLRLCLGFHVIALFLVLLFSGLAQAQVTPEPRKILAIYNPNPHPDIFHSEIHLMAEMPLNYLGLEVVYHKVNDPLPDTIFMKEYRGVITWFNQTKVVEDRATYCSWMLDQMKSGKKWVHIGNFGLSSLDGPMPSACTEMLTYFGVQVLGEYTPDPFMMEVVKKDSSMVEFERKIIFDEGLFYLKFKALPKDANVYLVIRRKDQSQSNSDAVFTTSRGGFVAPTFAHYYNADLASTHWRIDPFRFFEEAYGMKGLPRPDVTTLNGTRIFFSHIDGDGIMNMTQIEPELLSGEMIDREILAKYSTLPITVSLITGYFDMKEYQTDQVTRMYRSMFGRSNVEPASHGHAHPLIWEKGTVALKIPGYTYSPETEIVGSVGRVNQLLKGLGIPKKTSLFQWTGDCRPPASILQIASNAGFLTINGGDSKKDGVYDSYVNVASVGILKGGNRQIYTGAPNENIYTNLWEGPYYGFRDVIQTYQNTESPRRLKPINIYYHFYSGEKAASLKVLKQVYDFAQTQNINPIRTSEYVQMANDFFSTKMSRRSDQADVIENNGSLRTIRYDREKRHVDMNRSQGVLGYVHFQDSLYVHLDDSSRHEIALSSVKSQNAYVREATFMLKNARLAENKIEFDKIGWGKSQAIFSGLRPLKSYRVVSGEFDHLEKSDNGGNLQVHFDRAENGGAAQHVTITLESL